MKRSAPSGSADRIRPFVPVQCTLDECGGSFEKMLRRFVKRFRESGTLSEVYSRQAYVKPSQERRRRRKSPRGQQI